MPECFVIFSVNFLLIENLQRFDYFYGDELKVQCPTGSGNYMRLSDVAKELSSRLISLFIPDVFGYRPCHGRLLCHYTYDVQCQPSPDRG